MRRECSICSFWRKPRPISDHELLSYNFMNNHLFAKSLNYRLISSDNYNEITACDLPKFMQVSWKIHISIAEELPNVRLAWDNAIVPFLLRYNVKLAKIIASTSFTNPNRHNGKAITIYLRANKKFSEDITEFSEFLQQIETALMTYQITPGLPPLADKRIQGSEYLYFRCDSHKLDDPDENLDLPYLTDQRAIEIAQQKGTHPSNPFEFEDVNKLNEIILNNAPAMEQNNNNLYKF